MGRDLLIYGAGGAGRELAFSLSLNRDSETSWNVRGFIDDTEYLKGKIINDIKVLGGCEYLQLYRGSVAVCIVSNPKVKERLVKKIENNFVVHFPVITSSHSIVSPHAQLGEGCIISLPHNIISPNVTLGRHVFINAGTRIGHDSSVGDFTTIYSGVDIGGSVNIGPYCVIGSGTTILPKVKIGAGSIIGGGSLVNIDIPGCVVAAGIPAKIIREIE